MINALASDVALSWMGAAGCLLCYRFLWTSGEPGPQTRATLFLTAILAIMLTLRGFFWLYGSPALGRLVFAVATWLPLAVTLFIEHLLRRHHPLWLKLLAMATTAVFFLCNLAVNLAARLDLLQTYIACLTIVLAANGWLLAQVHHEELTRNERQFARAILLVTFLSLPLVVTDFRTVVGSPARLGALGALLFVYVVLGLVDDEDAALVLLRRILLATSIAAVLAIVFAAVLTPPGGNPLAAVASSLPVALGCTFLAAIVARMLAVSWASEGNRFLRWLLHARLDSVEHFIHSMHRLPQLAQHILLNREQLRGYSADLMFAAGAGKRELMSLAEARARARGEDDRAEGAEQLIDLLQRHEMTHALLIRREPPLIVLLNLPEGAHNAIGQLRGGVIQRLARRLAQ